MDEKKSKGQQLMESLSYKKKNFFEISSEKEIKEMYDYSEGYKKFLDEAKTEREAVAYAVRTAEAKGYKPAQGETVNFQAELTAVEKNDPTLRRENDGDPLVQPASGTTRRLNVMGAYRWRSTWKNRAYLFLLLQRLKKGFISGSVESRGTS